MLSIFEYSPWPNCWPNFPLFILCFFSRHCFNYFGRLKISNRVLTGSISQVLSSVPMVFHRFEAMGSLAGERGKRQDYHASICISPFMARSYTFPKMKLWRWHIKIILIPIPVAFVARRSAVWVTIALCILNIPTRLPIALETIPCAEIKKQKLYFSQHATLFDFFQTLLICGSATSRTSWCPSSRRTTCSTRPSSSRPTSTTSGSGTGSTRATWTSR